MDSISQIALGGAVAAAIAPAGHRRAALLAGAGLGTLPDLDGLLIAAFTRDPVMLMTVHRSFSHSLLVLPLLGTLIWWLYLRFGHGRVAQAPQRWWWAIVLALVTHPLLDAFTVYGTQLWWPFMPSPTMWSSVFIIDPLYTVWLLVGCAVAWFARARPSAQRALVAGLLLSSGYLGWSLLAKGMVEREAQRSLAAIGLGDAPRFSVPMPFNTLLWRVVAMTPQGYVVGDRSLWADEGPMQFEGHPSNVQALRQAQSIPAVARLQWFNRGFMRARVVDGELVLSDLRMGLEPDYNFNFAVARADGQGWRQMPPQSRPPAYRSEGGRELLKQRLHAMWQRIWTMPPPAGEAAAAPAVGAPSR